MMRIPGFVDLQVNGYMGVDFSNASLTEEEILTAFRGVLAQGTSLFLPTVITSAEETYKRNLPMLARAMALPEFAGRIPGLHLEGPFLSKEPGAVGAHNPDWVRTPDAAFFDKMLEWAEGKVCMLTIAAEAEGAADLTRRVVGKGIAVSAGHQLAQEEDLARLAEAGATAITHLGNGMPNMVARHKNTLMAGMAEDRLTGMAIADGHHLPHATLKVMLRAKGVEKFVVVSDASPLAGMPPGRYETLGNLAVLEESGLLHNPEKQCLVGSSAMMLQCMNVMASLDLLSFDDLLRVGIDNPLALIHRSRAELVTSDLVEFDTQSNVFRVV